MALAGRKGAGKTTLMRLIAGLEQPDAGSVSRHADVAMLDQHAAIVRDPEPLIEAMQRLYPSLSTNAAFAALARFAFRNEAARRSVSVLSGGERLRAALACVLSAATPPELLLLEEPTNHMDLDSLEALDGVLGGYSGALLVASHDRAFMNAIGIRGSWTCIDAQGPCAPVA